MKNTGVFIIYQPQHDDYLCEQTESENANLLGWHRHPRHALQFDTVEEAKRTAQRMSDHKGYNLLVCELLQSDTQFGVFEVAKVIPRSDPNLN